MIYSTGPLEVFNSDGYRSSTNIDMEKKESKEIKP